MKPRLTEREEREAEERLRKLPRLRLERDRRDAILQRTIAEVDPGTSTPPATRSSQDRRRPRRRWGAVAAAAASVVVVGGVAAIDTNGEFGSGPAHQRGHNKTGIAATSHPNQWMTDAQKRDLTAQAVASLFQGQPPKSSGNQLQAQLHGQSVPIVSMQAAQNAVGQRVYYIKMKGLFQEGTGAKSSKVSAKYLSFTVSADGSKVEAITGTNAEAQTKWSVKTSLRPKVDQLVYTGGNKDWTGVYRQGTATLMWENPVDHQTELGTAHTAKGAVWYTGAGSVPTVTKYSIGSASGSTSGNSLLPSNDPEFSTSYLDIVTDTSNIAVSITENGHKDTFLLRDAAQKNTVPPPMMKVVSIQPQEGGVLIHVQGKAQPAGVSIDDEQTQAAGASGGPQASFLIRDAKSANASVSNFAKFNQGGNPLIRSITVTPKGSDLLVQLKLNQPVNTLHAGVSGGYIGVSLQNQPSDFVHLVYHAKAVKNLPEWFIYDMAVAGSYQGTPMKPLTYGQMAQNASGGKYLLSAPLDPEANPGESVAYTSYFGAIPMLSTFKDLATGASSAPTSKVHTGYVKEVQNGKTVAVKAMLLDMANAWGFGFANSQVIVYSEHGGFFTYTVYPVPSVFVR